MISVALIADNRLVREGISVLLNQVIGIEVVAAPFNGDVSPLRRASPHVVLVDLASRNGDSLRAAERVVKEFPGSKVIVMDLPPVHENVAEFVEAGVSGCITKDATLEDLVCTIRAAVAGPRAPSPAMTGTRLRPLASHPVDGVRPAAIYSVRMTPREREVINLIAEGLSNGEMSDRLHIATYTVRSHVRNVMEKLMLHTRLQIAAYAHRDSTS